MRAILVCVDYSDLLSKTLPYNRHHFDEVHVVTTPDDFSTKTVAEQCDAAVHETMAFYDGGAAFNKWKALEQGLDAMGRHGWLCIMDADVLWPRVLPPLELTPGFLYCPLRRMMIDVRSPVPPESYWTRFPLHPQQREFAGYSQVFNADLDPHLPPVPPWHEINWRHAGGADSFFQMRWPNSAKKRLPFEVLHLGPAGVNWCGRASMRADGSMPLDAAAKQKAVKDFIRGRCKGPDRFSREKL